MPVPITTNDDLPQTMRALEIIGPQQVALPEIPTPHPGAGEVLVQTAYVGLCGADVHLFTGRSPYLRGGGKRYPFVIGHEWSGRVAALGAGVHAFQPGDLVVGHNLLTCGSCPACRAGRRTHCRTKQERGITGSAPGVASEYFVAPAATLTRVPAQTDLEVAAMLEPASTALHAVKRIRLHPHDRVAIFGTGMVGLCTAQLGRVFGATVHLVGIDPAGRALAESLGMRDVLFPDQVEPDAYDAAIEASGAPQAVRDVVRAVAPGGRIALVGIAEEPVADFPADRLTMKDAELHAVLSGVDQWDDLVALFASQRLDLEPLLDQVYPYSNAAQAFERAASKQRARPKVLLRFNP